MVDQYAGGSIFAIYENGGERPPMVSVVISDALGDTQGFEFATPAIAKDFANNLAEEIARFERQEKTA